MRLRKLKNGTCINETITIDTLLNTHNGIATYLASDSKNGHQLLHLFPDFEDNAIDKLKKNVAFHKTHFKHDTQCGQFEEFLFFSEPFPLGEFLFEWLEKRERVSVTDAISRILKILQILSQAHECGIYHGRITPQNILLERTSDSFEIRLMGLGIAQCMTPSLQLNIDWYDYTFDLTGMSPEAVDIYGMAVILMGLVSGEQGIDAFEATGLLPQNLRGGRLQQAMERALALRIDTYTNILAFSQDLEAVLLELDDKHGEVYVADLVGFESAIKNIANITGDPISSENSGEWSSLMDNLEQEKRSSLLCSLTSITNIKPIDDDDDEDADVTRVTSLPQSVLGLRRIRSAHSLELSDNPNVDSGDTNVAPLSPNTPSDPTADNAIPTTDDQPLPSATDHRAILSADNPIAQTDHAPKFAEIQSLEALLDDDDENDDAPTRIIQRPNYAPIPTSQETTSNKDVSDSIADILNTEKTPDSPIDVMTKRIQSADVVQSSHTLTHDTTYELTKEEREEEEKFAQAANQTPDDACAANASLPQNSLPDAAPKSSSEKTTAAPKPFTRKQKRYILILLSVILILVLCIVLKKAFGA